MFTEVWEESTEESTEESVDESEDAAPGFCADTFTVRLRTLKLDTSVPSAIVPNNPTWGKYVVSPFKTACAVTETIGNGDSVSHKSMRKFRTRICGTYADRRNTAVRRI